MLYVTVGLHAVCNILEEGFRVFKRLLSRQGAQDLVTVNSQRYHKSVETSGEGIRVILIPKTPQHVASLPWLSAACFAILLSTVIRRVRISDTVFRALRSDQQHPSFLCRSLSFWYVTTW